MSIFKRLFFFFVLIFGAIRLYYYLTDDFLLKNISYPMPYNESWKMPALSDSGQKALSAILDQKFHYLDKGAQCYTFLSEDQKYVLKFFKFKHLKPSDFLSLIPSIPPFKEFQKKQIEKKSLRLHRFFDSYVLAFKENREESGIIHLQLNQNDHLNKSVKIIDKAGFQHEANLENIPFMLQMKAEPLKVRLKNCLKENDSEKAKKSLSSILTLYLKEYQKGLYDRDHGVCDNFGFIGNDPCHIDIGKLSRDMGMKNVTVFKKDLELVIFRMDKWIKTNVSEISEKISPFLSEQFQAITGEAYEPSLIDQKRFKTRRR